jgi:HemY protein
MLWSLLKILFFVVLVAALTYGASLLMETGPGVLIAVGTIEFNLGPLQAVIAALVGLGLLWLVFKLAGLLVATVRFLNGDETALSRYFNRSRERKGFQALADGMMAIASGEGRVAIQKAAKAERYLRRPELTNLLTAQAAEMSGDTARATETYKLLLGDDRTRFVGVRGLMHQKLAQGDTETALRLAEKAFALKPKHVEVSDTLLRLQAIDADWSGARKTIGAKLRSGMMPRDVHKRRDAVLALAEARSSEGEQAQALALDANRMSPELVPAAVMAARAFIAQGAPRKAAKAIKTAWDAEPQPELAAAFAEIAPEETPAARIKRFALLTGSKPDHPETKLLLAELNIAAEDFPAARRALGTLAETDPTVRTLTILAAIERGEGADDQIVRAWLTRAISAPRDPQWICENCGHVHGAWVPVCAGCASFDTLAWKRPPESEMVTSSAAQMLPLIVGQAKPDAVEPSLALVEDAEEVSAPSEGASEASTSEEPRRAAS